jgi:DNA repair exonuclease SbcCD ATPase subunit
MSKLEEELEAERKLKSSEQSSEIKDQPKSAQQRLADTEAEIKAFKAQQDLESIKDGYESLKVREFTIADREKVLEQGQEKLKKDIGEFELQQKERVSKANEKADEYNKAYNLLKTEREEAKRIMTEAIAKKSEADNIIKSQTETEKINQEKQEAYTENMEESIKLFGEIIINLRRQEDSKSLSLAVILNKDLNLIQWLQYKKSSLQTIADIISVDCDRITQVCEYLQNSNVDNSKLLNYLLSSTEWLQNALKIEWQPND